MSTPAWREEGRAFVCTRCGIPTDIPVPSPIPYDKQYCPSPCCEGAVARVCCLPKYNNIWIPVVVGSDGVELKAADHYDFADAQREWSAPPFTSIGYESTEKLLRTCSDAQIKDLMERQAHYRFDGYVNDNNSWRNALDYPSTKGKVVMDFGCGSGIEALEFARAGAKVILADIAPYNVLFAARCFEIFGLRDQLAGCVNVKGERPYFPVDVWMDVFVSVGVLHHTPAWPQILRFVKSQLNPGGECRLIFYSEYTWPCVRDIHEDISKNPTFPHYVKGRDSVGHHADWVNRAKLELKVGDTYTVSWDHDKVGSGEYYGCHLKVRQ